MSTGCRNAGAAPRSSKSLAQSAADAAQAPIRLGPSESARQTAEPAISATAAAVPASAIWTDILQVAILPRPRSGALKDFDKPESPPCVNDVARLANAGDLVGFDCNIKLSNLWRAMALATLSLVCRPRHAAF